jgi:predicted NBD/HSP70 family sugar kinase
MHRSGPIANASSTSSLTAATASVSSAARSRSASSRPADVGRREASASVVLRTVLHHGPVARSVIARLTGLSPASVTGHSAHLVQLGLLCELPGATQSNGVGRPHVPVDVNTARYVVGAVHIAVPVTTVALVDLRGRVLRQHQEPHCATDPESVVERAAAVFAGLLNDYAQEVGPGAGATALGLGVATGGWVDSKSGILIEHQLLGWRDVPLRDLFGARTGIPVHVDGHSRALLQGERLFGLARGRSSVMHLFIGNVVDAAFAAGDFVYYGPRSQAGAIAHLPLDGSTEMCPCGRVGCLQAAASERTLERSAFDEGVIEAPIFALLMDAARRGNDAALRLFAERARRVGQATAMLLDVFDPELVVVVDPAVMLLPDGSAILDALHTEVGARVRSSLDVRRTVVPSSFSHDVLAVAGGSVVLDALYRDPLGLLAHRWSD